MYRVRSRAKKGDAADCGMCPAGHYIKAFRRIPSETSEHGETRLVSVWRQSEEPGDDGIPGSFCCELDCRVDI